MQYFQGTMAATRKPTNHEKRRRLTADQREEMEEKYNGYCYYCCKDLWKNKNETIIAAHHKPAHISCAISNFVPACASCNVRAGRRILPKGYFCLKGHNHGFRRTNAQLEEMEKYLDKHWPEVVRDRLIERRERKKKRK